MIVESHPQVALKSDMVTFLGFMGYKKKHMNKFEKKKKKKQTVFDLLQSN